MKIMNAILFPALTHLLLIGCASNKLSNNDVKIIERNMVNRLGENHYQTSTEIEIDAPISEVWRVLTDFDAMEKWSSSFKGIVEGKLKNGESVTVSYFINNRPNKVAHKLIYEVGVEYGWSDPLGGPFKGLKDNHRFRVEKISSTKTRFIQSDDFQHIGNGNISSEEMANFTLETYPTFNRELKQQVELLLDSKQ